MTSTNTIQNAIREIGYSKVHTANINGKTYEFFKLESDGYIYVLCADTERATRYNGEGQNGKRISMDAYLTALEAVESEAAVKELANTDPLAAAAEDPTVSVEEFCKMIEEANKPEPKTPKAKKTRKSKDIAYTYYESDGENATAKVLFTLTAKQVDFIKHLPDTCYWENGVESAIWVDCLCDEIGGQFENKPMTVGAMVSTLCEKGLGLRAKERMVDMTTGRARTATSFRLTALGQNVAVDLGLW